MAKQKNDASTQLAIDCVKGWAGTLYGCPNVAAVDEHIRQLLQRIAQGELSFPSLVVHYRDDIDLLLQRRLFLMEMEGGD